MRSRESVHGVGEKWVDISWIGSGAGGAAISPPNGSLRAMRQLAAEPAEIDAFLYLFALCKHVQTICLDHRGIDCILDADGVGRLPEAVCRMLGVMVCELVNDAGECTDPESAHEAVEVTLRRRGRTCLCTISSPCADSCACGERGLRRVQEMASELGDSCLVRPMPGHGVTAILFDIDLVERCFAAQIQLHRTEDAPQLAEQLSTFVRGR